jgi:hypothetical protein
MRIKKSSQKEEAAMKKRSNNKSDSTRSGLFETGAPDSTLRVRIERKAYELYEKRGRVHGLDIEDWFEAERVVMVETNGETRTETDAKAMTPARGKNMTTRSGLIQDQP